jgi:hypothetical protein
MNPSILPSKSFDKNYLLRLLSGNVEMMGVVLNEISHNVPHCLNEINSSLNAKDTLGVVTFASRARSAFSILREDKLAEAFMNIERSARNGEMSEAQVLFSNIFPVTLSCIHSIQTAVSA